MPNTWTDPYASAFGGATYTPKRAANPNEQVLGLYQSNFGRSPTAPEIDNWTAWSGGGSYLSPDALARLDAQLKREPEYAQYQGQRPTLSAGDYIPGVTLGTTLAADQAWRPKAVSSPLPSATSGVPASAPTPVAPIFQSPAFVGSLTEVSPVQAAIYRDDERAPAPPPPVPYVPPPAPAAPPPPPVNALIPSPLPGSTLPADAIANDAAAEQETTTLGLQSLLRDSLINLLNAKVPTAQDPTLAPAISSYGAAQNKATARLVNQNAEAFGAAGLESSGARLGADRAAIEQQGLNEGTFASNLVLNQLEAQRQQAQQGLQLALAMQDQDLSRRLQEQLAQLNAAVQRESLSQSGQLGQADLDLRQKLGYGSLNLGALGIAQGGRIANDRLGYDLAALEASLNNNALVRILTGA